MLVEMLVTELAVETLDVTILHGSPWLDQDVANPVRLRPSQECPTCEFRPVVGPNHLGIATKQSCLIQQPRDVLTRDPVVNGDIDALMAEVIRHGEILQSPAVAQAVGHKVHAPDLIYLCGQLQRHTLMHGTLGLLALANGQVGVAVKPIHPFVIHSGKLWSQQIVDPSIAKATTLMCDLHNAAT